MKARSTSSDWSFTDHICRVCFARIMQRETFDRRSVYKCSGCEIEAEARSESSICCCGIRLKTGVDAGIRCRREDNPTPEFPARITAVQATVPLKK